MEKETLKSFEHQCIQGEPAYCTAACPFHLDVKTFLRFMANNNMDKAFQVIEATLPLPEILSRICDHPCETDCLRKDLGGAITIGNLERACSHNRSRQKKHFPVPPKDKHAGIWGSGLSSLVAAWDLVLKGYRITVFDTPPGFGGLLRKLPDSVLPKQILDKEIDRLKKFGVIFSIATALKVTPGFDAVFIGNDTTTPFSYPDLDLSKRDPDTLQTNIPHVFVGGFSPTAPLDMAESYPIAHAAQGRKAATSMDRFMSQVSMTAGREREGAIATRLSTDVSEITPCPPTSQDQTPSGWDLDLAAQEAKRCIQCQCARCVRVCTYLQEFKGHPGQYAREIYNNTAIVMGERKSNLLINSCSQCNLCQTVCPNDFSMADLTGSARQEMVETDKMPESAHEFALAHMDWASSDSCFFARHAPGKDQSSQIFFPGCQLMGSNPDQVKQVYEFLLTQDDSTGFISGCCGAPAHWAGDEDRFNANIQKIKMFWQDAFNVSIITACTSCSSTLSKALPKVKIRSLYQELDQIFTLAPFAAPCQDMPDRAHIIDPCTASADLPTQDAVRNLAAKAGVHIQELDASKTRTECCGYGGLVFNANPDLSKKIIQNRATQGDEDFLAYCAMCQDRLASAGKPTRHILDLFWPQSQDRQPGFSRRQDNLALAKPSFLKDIWGKTTEKSREGHPKIDIDLTQEQVQALEDQFILVSDIRKVMAHYQTSGDYFVIPKRQSRVAFYRPSRVGFWVEFVLVSEKKSQFKFIDAWSHRMDVETSLNPEQAPPTQPLDYSIECGACQKPLAPHKNHMTYLGSRFDVSLPQCDQCGAIFISPDLTRGKIAEVEKILEDK